MVVTEGALYEKLAPCIASYPRLTGLTMHRCQDIPRRYSVSKTLYMEITVRDLRKTTCFSYSSSSATTSRPSILTPSPSPQWCLNYLRHNRRDHLFYHSLVIVVFSHEQRKYLKFLYRWRCSLTRSKGQLSFVSHREWRQLTSDEVECIARVEYYGEAAQAAVFRKGNSVQSRIPCVRKRLFKERSGGTVNISCNCSLCVRERRLIIG